MSTLIVHPEDPTTDFLKTIYKELNHSTIINGGVSKEDVRSLIDCHNRCIFLGHGTPYGLISMGLFDNTGLYIIDRTMSHLMSNQKENMYIWCHARSFVEKYNLHGIYSDMFISEMSEAVYYGFLDVSLKEITESNNVFSEIIGSNIDKSNEDIYDVIKTEYGRYARKNIIAHFNYSRIKIR